VDAGNGFHPCLANQWPPELSFILNQRAARGRFSFQEMHHG
jgi:hypothetical protein